MAQEAACRRRGRVDAPEVLPVAARLLLRFIGRL
jgi:hypothetical protein